MRLIALTALGLAIGTSAWAGPITYVLSGTGAGFYVDFADPGPVIGFGPEAISLVGHGETPGAEVAGVENVPLLAGEVVGLFDAASIPVGMESVFAVSSATGAALFGDYDGATYSPSVLFDGLGGYDGVSGLAATPVFDVTFSPFPLNADGHSYGVLFTSFTGAIFSASIPEPTGWALMLLGVGGMGARLRSVRRGAPVA